jgi:UDP-N-acetylmuramate--alanine ligase
VHFVAIGGVGMAAIAELFLKLGYTVSGSDVKASKTVSRLVAMGIPVTIGPHRSASSDGADHVVVSNAVGENNPEIEAARAVGAEILSRAELLGKILDAGRGIAVTGTHGKTTTSSMVACALSSAGFEPSFLIGGDLNDVGSGAHLGTSDIVVAEADEAFGSFLHTRPELALVTNIDLDHLEHYEDQAAIDDAFVTFLGQRRAGGWAVLCADDPGIARIRDRIADPVATYGSADADLVVASDGSVTWRGEPIGRLQIRVPGRHNLLNAAGALTVALLMGAEPAPVIEGLAAFGGVERRFSVRGEVDDVIVIDDYAHNPRKVQAALEAAREAYPDRRIVALFQPHLYSRTLHLRDRFGSSFGPADVVVVTDVYGAREEPVPGVNGRLVSDAIREQRPGEMIVYVPRLEEAAGFVAGLAQPGDVILTLGAGDVTTAAPRILQLLTAKDARR